MSTQAERAAELLRDHGQTFSAEAGIAIERGTPAVLWQLFELSLLHSANLSAELAMRATKVVRKRFPTSSRLAAATEREIWQALSDARFLRKSQTAGHLRRAAEHGCQVWRGDLRRLRDAAAGDAGAAAGMLREFIGIGEVGAEIFLREVQVTWPEFAPFGGDRVADAARKHRLPADPAALAGLVSEREVPRLMAALVRTGLQKG